MFLPGDVSAQSLLVFQNDLGIFDPERGKLTVTYQIREDLESFEVHIVDFRGQVANRLNFVDLRAGDHSFEWDGTNNNGGQVPEGRYTLNMAAKLRNGSMETAMASVVVASLEGVDGVPVPEPLPAEQYPHRIYGALSSFYRYKEDGKPDQDSAEVRFRTGLDFRNESTSARGVFQAIHDLDNSETVFNGSQLMAEQQLFKGSLKGVFRDNLGSFDDLFKLFSDFKSERNKFGARLEQQINMFNVSGLIFSSEGDVDSNEQGAAARIRYGDLNSLLLGLSFTHHQTSEESDVSTVPSGFGETEPARDTGSSTSSQALAADLRYQLTDSFALLSEAVASRADDDKDDYGLALKGELDLGSIILAAGYTNLGEDFRADFADPLHHVDRDAQGLDGSIDYFMLQPLGFIRSFSGTLRFFELTRHSNDTRLREIDGSFRLGLGDKDSVFMSLLNRRDEFGTSTTTMANLQHRWTDHWSQLLQANFSQTDKSESLRLGLGTNYAKEDRQGRLLLEWTRRRLEHSRFSPYTQTYLRLDLSNANWSLQTDVSYSHNEEESGLNFFGRLAYSPEFLHRYEICTYLSLGSRAAMTTEEQFELGIEVRF